MGKNLHRQDLKRHCKQLRVPGLSYISLSLDVLISEGTANFYRGQHHPDDQKEPAPRLTPLLSEWRLEINKWTALGKRNDNFIKNVIIQQDLIGVFFFLFLASL